MIDRTTKLRWRRRIRRSRQQVEEIGLHTEEHLERHLFRRLGRLYQVRRFILSWLLLIGVLITGVILQTRGLSNYYQILRPVPGGTYSEGILGAFTNANPLYATGGVDGAVSRLLFSGLLTYNQNNELVGDIAKSWQVDSTGKKYTVKLRDDVRWHDGKPLTAKDVVFTYQTIQNADAHSPLQSSWNGIKLDAPDKYTVIFRLRNTLATFPYALTTGIVPKHVLQGVPAAQLRSDKFNTISPVGTGPFRWDVLEVSGTTIESRQERIRLVANKRYHAGVPKLQRFVIRSYRSEAQLLKSFEDHEINAVVGLTTLPDTVKSLREVQDYSIPLTGEVMVFFNTSQTIFKDVRIRKALVKAADPDAIIRGLDHPVIPADGPLLKSHLGYDPKLTQLATNLKTAKALLDEAGWKKGSDGIRKKGNTPLKFSLVGQTTGEYSYVTKVLQEQWKKVGVEVEVVLQSDDKLQNTVATHDYQALLYGISLGTDPDVFAYWHSSQADSRSATRLNLSEYSSNIADRALEAGRTRSGTTLRAAKYRPFLKAWQADAPALALYQPRFLYITRGVVHGFNAMVMNNAIDRYANVNNWMIREVKTNR